MIYDTIIIGGGPCGLTAGMYLGRANKKVLILEKFAYGGQMAQTMNIENYPGEVRIDGFVLAEKMQLQCKSLGVEIAREEVVGCELDEQVKSVRTHKATYSAKTIIICTGAYAKPLNLENEKEFVGRGVSYCATCDGNFYKNKDVVVVGGGNTALEDCLYLSNIANKVYLVHRREEFRGDDVSVLNIKEKQEQGKVEFVLNSVIEKIVGNDVLSKVVVKNLANGKTQEIQANGLFVAIGRKPDTGFVQGLDLDEMGYIKTDEHMRTNIKGVFAGGDVRNTPLRQIVTACSDGAVASLSVLNYLAK